ncbi:MAG TPA: NAD(P)/FAD-dependent oxidoreductase [Terriglobales bacterium]|nr:NAD(P)/FAD-dependent oxidoreductase [Terriglobales bacterium]
MVNYDAIIVGAGHNGLVTAAYLAKAGKKVLVLEQRPIVGGIAVTEEPFPGFKYSSCAHLAGSFSSAIIDELDLKSHGFELLPLDPLLFAPSIDGKSLLIPRDPKKAAAEIGSHSRSDADKYATFCSLAKNLSGFLQTLYGLPLPDKANPGNFNPAEFLKIGWKFHRLGEKEMYEFLRVLPMSAADWLNEWFECDLLKAALAASGVLGSFVGPRQQGSALNLLHHQVGLSNGALRTAGLVRGGIGRLSLALAEAARRFGAEIRTGAKVLKITTPSGAAAGVALMNGEEIQATQVISSTDVKRTFLKLVDPTYLDPHFLLQVRNIRARGTVAKINLALGALPQFKSSNNHDAAALGGVIHIGETLDYLERAADDAKYGRFSRQPFLEITIPSIADPSLARVGQHVMSIWMQSAPYHLHDADWNQQREALGDCVLDMVEEYSPGFKNSVLHRQILTPLDLEQKYWLTGGHLYHAEIALDQIFFMRPVPGWSRYHTPIENLFLCGSGTHPGGGITGLPGYYAARAILKHRAR